MTVTSGSDEMNAPTLSDRFATSVTTTMMNAVIPYLVIRNAMKCNGTVLGYAFESLSHFSAIRSIECSFEYWRIS